MLLYLNITAFLIKNHSRNFISSNLELYNKLELRKREVYQNLFIFKWLNEKRREERTLRETTIAII